MLALGVPFEARDLGRVPLTPDEVRDLIGSHPPARFLNTRHALYRERGMERELPPPDVLYRLIAENVNLLRRPILVTPSGDVVIGYDETAYQRLATSR